eukprot:1161189-Pelagomonas_calceolata.AAC.3
MMPCLVLPAGAQGQSLVLVIGGKMQAVKCIRKQYLKPNIALEQARRLSVAPQECTLGDLGNSSCLVRQQMGLEDGSQSSQVAGFVEGDRPNQTARALRHSRAASTHSFI